MDGRELANGIDRAHRPIVKSNDFLERALTMVAKCYADLELMVTVVSLELSSQAGIRRNRQIASAVPVRDFTLSRRAGRPSRGQHGYCLQNCRFSAGIRANCAKPAGIDWQIEPAEGTEFVQL